MGKISTFNSSSLWKWCSFVAIYFLYDTLCCSILFIAWNMHMDFTLYCIYNMFHEIYTPPVTRSFDVFFRLPLNKRLFKQSRRRWFETPLHSLWRHRNGCAVLCFVVILSSAHWGLCNIEYPSETYLKPNPTKTRLTITYFSVTLSFRNLHKARNIAAELCAKFQTNWKIWCGCYGRTRFCGIWV